MTKKLDSFSSEDLMVKTAEGDEFAFEILVRRHQTSVLNLVYRYVGDRTKAKDLAQEVFIRVWRAAKRYEPKAKFTTWIYRITANLCLNELKSVKGKKLIQLEAEHEDRQNTNFETHPMLPSHRKIFCWPKNAAVKSPKPSRTCQKIREWL